MDFKIIISIFVWIISSFAAGAPQLTCPSQTVSAEEGGRVNISVFMDPQRDMTDDDLIIERADHKNVIVHHYDKKDYQNNRVQAAEYKNRTSVSKEDLIRGVLDLEIRNLSLNDSGSYRVSSIDHKTVCTFNISVAAKVDGADEGRSQTETLKTVLLVSVVLLIIITVAVVYLWRSGWIRKVWSRLRGRVCRLFGGSKGPDPDPDPEVKFKPVPGDDADPQVVLSST